MIKKILLVLLGALIIIQFIHPKKNQAESAQPNYIATAHEVPTDIKRILANACNDCHSNNTAYPWYSRIQPFHWWLNHHIQEGKERLNFDEYTNKSLREQYHQMKETLETVKEGEMPLKSYTWLHKEARLSASEKDAVINWAKSVMAAMKAQYPPDSLERKK